MQSVRPQPHVLLLFRHRYNPMFHESFARYAGRVRWHLSMLIHPTDRALVGLDSLQGVAVADRFPGQVIAPILQSRVPCVNLSANPPDFPAPRVTGDDIAMGRTAAEYLMARHHRSYAFFGIPDSLASSRRGQGFVEALGECGHRVTGLASRADEASVVVDWTAERAHLQEQLAVLPVPSAVFCYNDLQASRLLDAAVQLGRRVPEELAILGVDDDPLVCETGHVPLSSVRHDLRAVGTRAAELLDHLMHGGAVPPGPIEVAPRGVTTRLSTEHFAAAHPTIQAILLHIDRHHARAIGLGDVAAQVGLSPRMVQHLLQVELGSTFTAELQSSRLRHAQRLLADSSEPIIDIAATVGFASAPYFHRAFKRHAGVTPQAYRRLSAKT